MKKYFLILITFFLTSCNFNRTFENREEDKKDAEKITTNFFILLKNNDRNGVAKLFSDKFFQVTSKEKLNQMLNYTNKVGGKMLNNSLSNWETTIVKGTNPKADYLMTYYVKRDSINTQEIFSLQKENDSIKIVGYKIDLDIATK